MYVAGDLPIVLFLIHCHTLCFKDRFLTTEIHVQNELH